MLRIVSVVLALIAVILFVVAAIVNATTNPTSVQHYLDWGLALFAGSFGTFVLSTIVDRTPQI